MDGSTNIFVLDDSTFSNRIHDCLNRIPGFKVTYISIPNDTIISNKDLSNSKYIRTIYHRINQINRGKDIILMCLGTAFYTLNSLDYSQPYASTSCVQGHNYLNYLTDLIKSRRTSIFMFPPPDTRYTFNCQNDVSNINKAKFDMALKIFTRKLENAHFLWGEGLLEYHLEKYPEDPVGVANFSSWREYFLPYDEELQRPRMNTFCTYLFRGWAVRGWISEFTIREINAHAFGGQRFDTPPPPYDVACTQDETQEEDSRVENSMQNLTIVSPPPSCPSSATMSPHDRVPTNTPLLLCTEDVTIVNV